MLNGRVNKNLEVEYFLCTVPHKMLQIISSEKASVILHNSQENKKSQFSATLNTS
jgi:hypothetical protein